MKLTRRGLFRLLAASPLAAFVPVPAQPLRFMIHDEIFEGLPEWANDATYLDNYHGISRTKFNLPWTASRG